MDMLKSRPIIITSAAALIIFAFTVDTIGAFFVGALIMLIMITALVVTIWYFSSVHRYRCPKCHHHGLKCVGGSTDGPSLHFCFHCKARLAKEMDSYRDATLEEWADNADPEP